MELSKKRMKISKNISYLLKYMITYLLGFLSATILLGLRFLES